MKQGARFVIPAMLALVCSLAHGQGSDDAKRARAKLTILAGSFATETHIPPLKIAPKGASGTGTSVIAWGLDSMFLVIDEKSANTLFGMYKGHGLLGYEAATHQYVLSMFNNFGDHPVYKGDFSGDTLVVGTTVAMPGRSFDQKLYWYKDGDALRLRIMNDTGKGFQLTLEQTYLPAADRK